MVQTTGWPGGLTPTFLLIFVVVCTAHLCLGIFIGCMIRARGNYSTTVIREVLPEIERDFSDRLVDIERLGKQADHLSEMCSLEVPSPSPELSDAVARVVENIASLRQLLLASLARLADAQGKPSSPRQTVESARSVMAGEDEDAKWMASVICPTGGNDSCGPGARHRYTTLQYAAEEDDLPPRPDDFVPIRTQHLSRDSVTFFINELPVGNYLVISLGSPSDLRFLSVEVVSSKACCIDGVVGYSLECRLLRRLEDFYEWDPKAEKICYKRLENMAFH